MSNNKSEKKHGGIRAGAGRPKVKNDSIVMRVPVQYRDAIKDLISTLDGLKTEPSKVERETEWRMLHLDTADLVGSARYKISVGKY